MATWTFHEYLRLKANIHVSWEHRQLELPPKLPKVEKQFQIDPPDLIRFYQNPCLYGYTFAFWSWEDNWSAHLDWMALNGINLVLASRYFFKGTHPFKYMPIPDIAYFINTLDCQSSGRGRGGPNYFKVGDLFQKICTSHYANL